MCRTVGDGVFYGWINSDGIGCGTQIARTSANSIQLMNNRASIIGNVLAIFREKHKKNEDIFDL